MSRHRIGGVNAGAWFWIRCGIIFWCALFFSGGVCLSAETAGNVLFIVDASGSMADKLAGTPKIDLMKKGVADLVNALPAETNVGLMVFGGARLADCTDVDARVEPGPADKKGVTDALQSLRPTGASPVGLAIEKAAEKLKALDVVTAVILVADGRDACLGDPCELVRELTAQHVKMVFNVIGLGLSEADREQLICVAGAGNGSFVNVDGAVEFRKALKKAIEIPESLLARSAAEAPAAPEADAQPAEAPETGAGPVPKAAEKAAPEPTPAAAPEKPAEAAKPAEKEAAPPEEKAAEPEAETVEAAEGPVRTVRLRVSAGRVRSAPNLQAEIKFVMKEGETAEVIETRGEWLHIRADEDRIGWSHESLFEDVAQPAAEAAPAGSPAAPDAAAVLTAIRVKAALDGPDEVTFAITGNAPPRMFIIDKEETKVVCDFPDATLAPALGAGVKENKGTFVTDVRIGVHSNPDPKIRVVLDLAPGNTYVVEDVFSAGTDRYTLTIAGS